MNETVYLFALSLPDVLEHIVAIEQTSRSRTRLLIQSAAEVIAGSNGLPVATALIQTVNRPAVPALARLPHRC